MASTFPSLLQTIPPALLLASTRSFIQPVVGFFLHNDHRHQHHLISSISSSSFSPQQLNIQHASSSSTTAIFSYSSFVDRMNGILIESSSLSSSSTISSSSTDDVSFEDAFNDKIDLFGDSTIQLLFLGFSILIILSIVAKTLLNQMDDAIEKVLVDFETTMKTNDKYKNQWMGIQQELELEGLSLEESEKDEGLKERRAQKLFEIMERLQRDDPKLMEKVNNDMMRL